MKISITQDHIQKGLQGSANRDPVALAMIDAGLNHPWVSPNYLAFQKDGRAYHVEIPDDVLDFVKKFDNQNFVTPFEFSLEGV